MLFVIPWGRHWIIGTTDTDWHLDKSHPAASSHDIDYLLSQVNRVLSRPLNREDVEGVYAGLRPLLAGESESTSKLSREHVVGHPVPGLVVVAGGKYTTYRVMAADAVDEVARALDGRVPPSCTERIPLLGADGYDAAWNSRQRTATRYGVHVARVEHLLRRYGSLAPEVLELVEDDADAGRAAARRRRLPRGRGRLRLHARGRPAPRRRADPPDPDLDRVLGPRRRRRAGRGGADGRRARLERTSSGTRRSSTTWPGSRPSASPRSSRTTRPPTRARLGAPEIVPLA